MTEEELKLIREEQNLRMKEYRQNNLEKCRARDRKHYAAHKEQIKETRMKRLLKKAQERKLAESRSDADGRRTEE